MVRKTQMKRIVKGVSLVVVLAMFFAFCSCTTETQTTEMNYTKEEVKEEAKEITEESEKEKILRQSCVEAVKEKNEDLQIKNSEISFDVIGGALKIYLIIETEDNQIKKYLIDSDEIMDILAFDMNLDSPLTEDLYVLRKSSYELLENSDTIFITYNQNILNEYNSYEECCVPNDEFYKKIAPEILWLEGTESFKIVYNEENKNFSIIRLHYEDNLFYIHHIVLIFEKHSEEKIYADLKEGNDTFYAFEGSSVELVNASTLIVA